MIEQRALPYAALFLRVFMAGLFAAHLYRKFAVLGFDTWWNGFRKAGYPEWTLAYTLGIEFAGSFLLLLGIYTRYVSLLALPVMIAIVIHWSTRRGFWFADGGIEFPLAWCAMLIVQAVLGNGAYAVPVAALPWERQSGNAGATA
jgi:putative oxidoreductase